MNFTATKFRFIGDPHDNYSGPDTMVMCGYTFNRREWTEVTDPNTAMELMKHTHFESSEAAAGAVAGAVAQPRAPEARAPGVEAQRQAQAGPVRAADANHPAAAAEAQRHPADVRVVDAEKRRSEDAGRAAEATHIAASGARNAGAVHAVDADKPHREDVTRDAAARMAAERNNKARP